MFEFVFVVASSTWMFTMLVFWATSKSEALRNERISEYLFCSMLISIVLICLSLLIIYTITQAF